MIRFVPVLLAVLATAAPAQQPDPLARVVTVGASLTAGFGTWLPLRNLLQTALPDDATPIRSHHDVMFFRRPETIGKRQIDRTLAMEPTLVVAIDFLFWYGYGYQWVREEPEPNHIRFRRPTEEEGLSLRLADLERGLAELDRVPCTIVVGDFPNMAGAHPWMLGASQIPSEVELAKLNERLRAWAAERPRVHVIPLAASVDRLRAGDWTVTPPGGTTPVTLDAASALQWDRLHPTRLGVVYLCDELVDSMRDALGLAPERLQFDPVRAIERLDLQSTVDDLRRYPTER